jgi:hypothetical protein
MGNYCPVECFSLMSDRHQILHRSHSRKFDTIFRCPIARMLAACSFLYTVVDRKVIYLPWSRHKLQKCILIQGGSSGVSKPICRLTEEWHSLFSPPHMPLLLLPQPTMLPPENASKGQNHQIHPQNHHPLPPRNVNLAFPSLPILADLKELLRIVGDDAVEAFADAPPHHIFFVHGPCEDGSSLGFRIAHEALAEEGGDEGFLQHVEGDVGDGEELPGVGYREADVRYRECREVFSAEGEEFGGPAAEDETLVPGLEGVWRDGSDGFGDEAHYGIVIIVELAHMSGSACHE